MVERQWAQIDAAARGRALGGASSGGDERRNRRERAAATQAGRAKEWQEDELCAVHEHRRTGAARVDAEEGRHQL